MNTTTTIYAKHEPKKAEPAAAEKKPEDKPPKPETKNEKILAVLERARERLRGRGSPELDVEVDELIAEVKTWGK